MKLDDVLVINGVNIIIGRGDYDVSYFISYLYNLYNDNNIRIYDKPDIYIPHIFQEDFTHNEPKMIIYDIRNMNDSFVNRIAELLISYMKGEYFDRYKLAVLVLCNIKDSSEGNTALKQYIDIKNLSIVYQAGCILKYIDSISYEIVKSANCKLHEIINLKGGYMKLSDVLVTNGVNMIIGRNDYDVNNLKLYLLKSYSIVDYDGSTLFGLDIMKGEEQSKPSIFIIDIRYKEYNDTEYVIDLVNAYVKGKYDTPLLILCSINNNCTFEPKPVENYFANNGLDKESLLKGLLEILRMSHILTVKVLLFIIHNVY